LKDIIILLNQQFIAVLLKFVFLHKASSQIGLEQFFLEKNVSDISMDPLTMRFFNQGINQEQRRVNNLSTVFEIGPQYYLGIVRLFVVEY
jgi:hypothetical protein